MQKILKIVGERNLAGDIVEFGTWQGQGLRLLDLAAYKKFEKKLIGIDSFQGLPTSSTIWQKGAFSNTSVQKVERNIIEKIESFSGASLIEGWFDDPAVAEKLYSDVSEIAVVHLDADLGVSTLQALKVLEPYFKTRKQPMFLLFDDWGCHPNEVPDAFNAWLNEAQSSFGVKAEVVCFTNLTRYYELSFE